MRSFLSDLMVHAGTSVTVSAVIVVDDAKSHRNPLAFESFERNCDAKEKDRACGVARSRWDEKRIERGPVIPSRKLSEDHSARSKRKQVKALSSTGSSHEIHHRRSWPTVLDTAVQSNKLASQAGHKYIREAPSHTRHVSPNKYRST